MNMTNFYQKFLTTTNNMDEPLQEYKFNAKDHIHTYLDKPLMGTSTVVGVISKPLTYWASGLAVGKLGWTNSKLKEGGKYINIPLDKRISHAEPFLEQIKGMTTPQYLDLLDEAYKAHATKLDDSAKSGTDMHAIMEEYVKNCVIQNKGIPTAHNPNEDKKLSDFIDWSLLNVKRFLWSELYCYSNTLWVGGISDCGVELNDGKVGIIDFKSSKESYDSQFIQCAGYDLQISENGGFTDNGYPVFSLEKEIEFYAIIPFGADKFTVDFRYNTGELKDGFKSCLTLHKLLNK